MNDSAKLEPSSFDVADIVISVDPYIPAIGTIRIWLFIISVDAILLFEDEIENVINFDSETVSAVLIFTKSCG